ncbi:unnamed protein product [Calypogeia fissa]
MSSGIEEEDDEHAAADSGSIATVLIEAWALLRNGAHTQHPAVGPPQAALSPPNKQPSMIAGEVVVTPPNKQRLRPRKTGLLLKEPDTDISDVSDCEPQAKPRLRKMAVMGRAIAKPSVKC